MATHRLLVVAIAAAAFLLLLGEAATPGPRAQERWRPPTLPPNAPATPEAPVKAAPTPPAAELKPAQPPTTQHTDEANPVIEATIVSMIQAASNNDTETLTAMVSQGLNLNSRDKVCSSRVFTSLEKYNPPAHRRGCRRSWWLHSTTAPA